MNESPTRRNLSRAYGLLKRAEQQKRSPSPETYVAHGGQGLTTLEHFYQGGAPQFVEENRQQRHSTSPAAAAAVSPPKQTADAFIQVEAAHPESVSPAAQTSRQGTPVSELFTDVDPPQSSKSATTSDVEAGEKPIKSSAKDSFKAASEAKSPKEAKIASTRSYLCIKSFFREVLRFSSFIRFDS